MPPYGTYKRGEVWVPAVALPEPDGELKLRRKYAVLLRDETGFPPARETAFVLLSSHRGKEARAFEVLVDPDKFDLPEGLRAAVGVIDGRWVRTVHRSVFDGVDYIGMLPDAIMNEIDYAIGIGLGMTPAP